MKNIFSYILIALLLATGLFVSCKQEEGKPAEPAETMTSGKLTVYVDNTAQPIIEDVLAIYHTVYDKATITQVNRNESDIVNAILRDSANVVVMARLLTPQEEAHFAKKSIKPRITHFATDALALITNRNATDTVVDLNEIYKVLQGKESAAVKKLVFDNSSSGTVQYLLKEAGATEIPANTVFSLKNTKEVLDYVQANPGSIGIVGVNWLVQPPLEWENSVEKIRVLGVNNVKGNNADGKYYKPSQSNIAAGLYPLSRKLYVLNYQGRDGLGMGFATYLSAPEGQRIILKSGLVPATIPPRQIEVRKEL